MWRFSGRRRKLALEFLSKKQSPKTMVRRLECLLNRATSLPSRSIDRNLDHLVETLYASSDVFAQTFDQSGGDLNDPSSTVPSNVAGIGGSSDASPRQRSVGISTNTSLAA